MINVAPYDFCLAYNSEHDVGFARLIEASCNNLGISLLLVNSNNVAQITDSLLRGELAFRTLLDRASDEEPRFMPLAIWAAGHQVYCFNPFKLARRAWNKARMHELLHGAVHTPFTEIVPPYQNHPGLPHVDFDRLGPQFTVKPAHGGGGLGVVNDVDDFFQIQRARQELPQDQFLLQRKVIPVVLDEKHPAWFRLIYAAGLVHSCFWNPQTHIYASVTKDYEEKFELYPLVQIGRSLAEISGLGLFSTEVALTEQGNFIVVDYINDPIDLRLLSDAPDGVPDELVRQIAKQLAEHVSYRLRRRQLRQPAAAATPAFFA